MTFLLEGFFCTDYHLILIYNVNQRRLPSTFMEQRKRRLLLPALTQWHQENFGETNRKFEGLTIPCRLILQRALKKMKDTHFKGCRPVTAGQPCNICCHVSGICRQKRGRVQSLSTVPLISSYWLLNVHYIYIHFPTVGAIKVSTVSSYKLNVVV